MRSLLSETLVMNSHIVVDGKERRYKFTPTQTEALEVWFSANNHYPTPTEKEMLMVTTGLTQRQVDNWFTNTRKRRKQRDTKPRTQVKRRQKRIRARQRENFGPHVKATLMGWAWAHRNYPYPTPEQKAALASKTNITYDQVQHWFVNWRMRVWRKMETPPLIVMPTLPLPEETVDAAPMRSHLYAFRQPTTEGVPRV